jgi:Bacterial HORMA domain family 1
MSYSYTQTETKTFTETHAKHIASKVATDLKRMQRFYGEPNDANISSYERELIEFLKKGYLGTVTYGYKKNDHWIEPALRYTAKELSGMNSTDDDPGKITANANIEGASFYSFLTYNSAWDNLSNDEKDAFKKTLPFQRGSASEPGVNGYMSNDKSYSAGGKSLDRSTLKKY